MDIRKNPQLPGNKKQTRNKKQKGATACAATPWFFWWAMQDSNLQPPDEEIPGVADRFFHRLRRSGSGPARPRGASRYFYSRVNFTPSPASFRFTPLVFGWRWITTPFLFFIAVAPTPTPTVACAAADTYVPLKSSSFFKL